MRRSAARGLTSVLIRVALAYVLLFAVWLGLARHYHLLLAQTAGLLVPAIAEATVENIALVDASGRGEGARFRIVFHGRDPNYTRGQSGTVNARTDTVVDIRQFGYPMLTFLALALGVRPPRRPADLLFPLLGGALLFLFFTMWVLVEIYQYVSSQDVVFLRDNLIVRVISPAWYHRFRIPLIVYLGQLIPIGVFGVHYLIHAGHERHPAAPGVARHRRSRS